MLDLVASLLTGKMGASLQRIARLAFFATVAAALVAVAFVALVLALFWGLEPRFGAIGAALIVAGGALALAGLASIPLWLKPKPEPPSTLATLVELGLAVGLGLLARKKDAR